MSDLLIYLIGGAAVIVIIVAVILMKYKRSYVFKHSTAIAKMDELNKEFEFKVVQNRFFEYSFENQRAFDSIECIDYLIYRLYPLQEEIRQALEDSKYNKESYIKYASKANNIKFDSFTKPSYKKVEKDICITKILHPNTDFSIEVYVYALNVYGVKQYVKKKTFKSEDIEKILNNLGDTKIVTESINKIEASKFTKDLKIQVIKRDSHKCYKCGHQGFDVDVEYIVPIEKGGKTTLDNLRTVCQNCKEK